MKSSALAKRYAKAIFSLAMDNRSQDKVLNDLRALESVLESDPAIRSFVVSPMIPAAQKLNALNRAIEGRISSAEVVQFLNLLAKKDRLSIFAEIVEAFQAEIDAANNVCRGTVKSTTALSPSDRAQIEKTVEGVLKKKVIMTYKVDPSVIGGLVAQVGSHTFDDSLSTHLKRLSEELKRRTI
jgi:F-type H+-transporting ATPase subunit delta